MWRVRSHDQNRSVYGGWLAKQHLRQFSRRKKAQRGIRNILYLFQCVTRGIQTVFRKSDLLAVSYPLKWVILATISTKTISNVFSQVTKEAQFFYDLLQKANGVRRSSCLMLLRIFKQLWLLQVISHVT